MPSHTPPHKRLQVQIQAISGDKKIQYDYGSYCNYGKTRAVCFLSVRDGSHADNASL